jgi:hypothetical protein
MHTGILVGKITTLEYLNVDYIRMVFLEMGWNCMMWIHLS